MPIEELTLLPCPSCDGPADAFYFSEGGRVRHSVNCVECGMQTGSYRNRAAAAEAWNRRAHPTPTAADTAYDPTTQPYDEPFRHVAADTGLVERLTAERDKWEETAKYSEKRVAVWQEKCFAAEQREAAAREQIAALKRENANVAAALNTQERGEGLVAIARVAHEAEMASPKLRRELEETQDAVVHQGRQLEAASAALSSAQETISLMKEALSQVKTVCEDNAPETCRHDLALKFVGQVVALTLAREKNDGQ